MARSCTSRGWARRKSAEQTSTAAPPSPTGEHMARVKGQLTGRSFSTSSTDRSKLYCAFSLSAPLR